MLRNPHYDFHDATPRGGALFWHSHRIGYEVHLSVPCRWVPRLLLLVGGV